MNTRTATSTITKNKEKERLRAGLPSRSAKARGKTCIFGAKNGFGLQTRMGEGAVKISVGAVPNFLILGGWFLARWKKAKINGTPSKRTGRRGRSCCPREKEPTSKNAVGDQRGLSSLRPKIGIFQCSEFEEKKGCVFRWKGESKDLNDVKQVLGSVLMVRKPCLGYGLKEGGTGGPDSHAAKWSKICHHWLKSEKQSAKGTGVGRARRGGTRSQL